MWNNNKNDGENGNAKEQSKSFLNEEEFKKALIKLRLRYGELLSKLKEE